MTADVPGGVKCFSISGRMIYQRQRCLGMTDEERRWRAQWLKDQVLSPDEPRNVPEYYKETTNIFRRLWKTPMYKLQCALEPSLGKSGAFLMRHGIGKGIIIISSLYILTYCYKYCGNDFCYARTFQTYAARPKMYPSDPGYPNFPEKTSSDYFDLGFYSSVLCQDVEPIEEIPPAPTSVVEISSCPPPDFTYARTFQIYESRPKMYPYDPGYPNFTEKTDKEYFDLGFSSSVLAKKM